MRNWRREGHSWRSEWGIDGVPGFFYGGASGTLPVITGALMAR